MSGRLTFEKCQRRMADRLAAANNDMAALDARLLLQYAANMSQTELALVAPDEVPASLMRTIEPLIAARLAGKPVAKIIGRKAFWGHLFHVNEAVLDPRPDSETLLEAVLAKCAKDAPGRLLDLGTGSACLALSVLAERPSMRALGIDKSPAALAVARRNAHALSLRRRIALRHSDWFSAVDGRFDVIMSNPPYITEAEMAALPREVRAHDPHMALCGGVDGLDPYRHICARAGTYLKPGGWLAFEFGIGQGAAIEALMQAGGFCDTQLHADLTGRARAITAQKR